jgi:hypothetical protein
MDGAIVTDAGSRLPSRRRIMALLALAGLMHCASEGLAQESNDAKDGVRLQTTSVGIGRYARGKWGVRGVEVANRSDAPADVEADVTIGGDPLMEFARRAWLPSRSRRRMAIPIQPAGDESDQIQVRTGLSRGPQTSSAENPNAESLGGAQPPVTVIISDREDSESVALSDTREMVVALRLAGGNTRNLSEFTVDEVPSFVLGLDAADEIVVVGNQLCDSPAALATLGIWVQRGGKLWIPLDCVDLRTVERLLSDVVQITVVDRARLSQVNLWNVVKGIPSGTLLTREAPVEMVRVITSDVSVIHEVDGWPASFWVPVGDGQVLFTTLSPKAWMRPRAPHEQVQQLERNSSFIAETGLDELATYMATPLNPPPLTATDFADYLSGDVGLRIPSRATIVTVLGLFWAVWLVIGYRFLRQARLERLAVVGPALAFLAAAPLAVLGHQLRSAAPPTAAVAEFVRVGAGASGVHSSGAATLFVPGTTETQITANQGRMIVPHRDRLDGKRRELQSTDLDDWSWAALTLPTGVQGAATEQHISLAAPLKATATFGPDGLHGKLQMQTYLQPTDLLIAAASSQTLAVRLNPDGTFSAGKGDTLEPGAYFSSALLTDQQRRRNVVYDRLLQQGRDSRFPQHPTLLAWARPAETGLQFAEAMEQSATALLAIPLEFAPTPPGTDIEIPSPLMTYDVVGTADGLLPTVYDPRTGRWQKSTAAADVIARFRVPESVMPLVANKATLSLRIRAPKRTVELSAGLPQKPAPITTLNSPEGPVMLQISGPDTLAIGDDGTLRVRLQVSELQVEGADAAALKDVDRSWQVESIGLELSGRTGERAAEGDVRE